ncbi:MAG: HlyD family efflux transporter periplasmic adaptor subunit [Lewinellaceae bacterium]|nr:HlyD family efflux transporter periplasmic adaptor subunit [Phaeodactylibacter sp.]MCB9038121.1 HlyD family efflux transporter periplasmic adaptor subunit [Lewinellaceae bacterium]
MKASSLILLLASFTLTACQEANDVADAYGNFEAREVIVSAEGNGQLLNFDVEEGKDLTAGQQVGLIDTTQLHLKRQQLLASIRAVTGKTQEVQPQINVLLEQKQNLKREEKRLQALVADNAATPKQLDDIQGQIEVVDKQIAATLSQNKNLNQGILAEIAPLQAQIEVVEDQIRKCYVVNPIDGAVLLKLAEPYEMAAMGKPLYTIAKMGELELRAYISGEQLPHIKIGQQVEVLIDADKETNRSLPGTVSWISDKAEFTPKTIQTKEERVNLVYAFKVKVKNDGSLKIGMPGEVVLAKKDEETAAK